MSSPTRFVALQHRDFRLLWFGRLISASGSSMQKIAIHWHIVQLLHGQTFHVQLFDSEITLGAEALGLGLLGLVRVVPVIVFSMLGGMVADNMDRRKVMIVAQSALLLFSGLLAWLTLAGAISMSLVYLLSAAAAATIAFDAPARHSLVTNIVPRHHLTNAVSLNRLLFRIASISGSAVAGLLISEFNVGVVYVLDAISFLAVLLALLLMQYRRPPDALNIGYDWSAVKEGLHFTFRSHLILSSMLLDFFATFFASADSMLPLVARDILGTDARGYGILATAQPVGAVLAGFVLSWRRDIYRPGAVLLASVAIYGLATALFGISTIFTVSYVLFAIIGTADTVSSVIRATIRQLVTPDHLRGRMTSISLVFFMGGPELGELEAGLVAAAFGVPLAIFTGGLATATLTGLIAWRYPNLRTFTLESAQELPAT